MPGVIAVHESVEQPAERAGQRQHQTAAQQAGQAEQARASWPRRAGAPIRRWLCW